MIDISGPGLVAAETERGDRRRRLSLAVLLLAIFVATLDNFIVFVAVPSIRTELGATFAQAELIVAAYTLTLALGMITSGRLGDRFGRRRMFLIGFGAFTLASGLCGIAPSANSLIVYRIVQGVASANLSPQVLALIRVTFTDARERANAFAWMGVSIGMAGVLGQVIGGIVVSANIWDLAWRPVFLLNLPIGLLALAVGPFVLDESRAAGSQRLDLVGAVLSSLGLGMLLYPLIEGREAGWPAWSFGMLAASIVILGLFAIHQHRKTLADTSPLLNTGLFFDRAFTVGLLLILVFYGTISPFILSFSYLLQIGFELSPVKSALYFSPLAIAFMATNLTIGRLSGHDPRRTLFMGAVIATLGTALACATCAFIPSFSPVMLIPAMTVIGLGQGLFMTPVVNTVLSGIPERHTGAASGVLSTMQRVGNAMGVAVLEIPFFATLDHVRGGASPAQAYTAAFAVVAGWLVVAMIVVMLLLALLPARARN